MTKSDMKDLLGVVVAITTIVCIPFTIMLVCFSACESYESAKPCSYFKDKPMMQVPARCVGEFGKP